MKRMTIVCDMDDCTVDISDKIRLRVNKDFNKNYPKGFNKSYWWSDYGIPKNYFENLLNEKDLFLNLQPIEGAIEALIKLYNEGYDIHILTFPQHNENCFYEKILWIQKYLPFINIETNFHTSGNKGLFAKEDRVLIDDNPTYINQFRDNGGYAIIFNQGWNKSCNGARAFNWNEVYDYIKLYEDVRNFNNLDMKVDIDIDKFRKYMEGACHE
jgi:5'(3')-deoxyribonucleotidase